MKNKRGLSTIISILIIIAITMIAAGIVWGVARSVIKDRIDYSEACSIQLLDNVKINSINTCYYKTDGYLKLYTDIGNAELEKIIVYITYGGETKTTELKTNIGINSGKKHLINLQQDPPGFTLILDHLPEAVKIAPVVKGQQCGTIDSFYQIPQCSGDCGEDCENIVLKNNGDDCDDGSQCIDKNCVDNVCCFTSSCPDCKSCNLNGQGTCSNDPAGTFCTGGTCDGNGKCVIPIQKLSICGELEIDYACYDDYEKNDYALSTEKNLLGSKDMLNKDLEECRTFCENYATTCAQWRSWITEECECFGSPVTNKRAVGTGRYAATCTPN